MLVSRFQVILVEQDLKRHQIELLAPHLPVTLHYPPVDPSMKRYDRTFFLDDQGREVYLSQHADVEDFIESWTK